MELAQATGFNSARRPFFDKQRQKTRSVPASLQVTTEAAREKDSLSEPLEF